METPSQKKTKVSLWPASPLKIFLNPRMRTIHSVLFVLDCQVISEVKADTCITFTKPNSTENMYIRRSADLCVFINENIFSKPNAWNRAFSCNGSMTELSVCFSDTKISDSGSFYLIVGNIQENSTLNVERKWRKLYLSTNIMSCFIAIHELILPKWINLSINGV